MSVVVQRQPQGQQPWQQGEGRRWRRNARPANDRIVPGMHRPAGLLALITVTLIFLGVWAYRAALRPDTAAVTRRDLVATVNLPAGEVITPPTARADVYAPFRAPVARVYASVGQRVAAGDVLAELAHPTAQAAYEQARAQVQAAEADLSAERARYQPAVDAARRELAHAGIAERAARRRANVTVAAAATVVVDRAAIIEEVGKEATPSAAPAALMAAAVERRVVAQQALRDAEAVREAALAVHRRRLHNARIALADAEAERKTALVRAPVAGTVLALNARTGVEVGNHGKKGDGAKTPLATIVDLARLEVHAPVPERHLPLVKPGAPVTLNFDGLRGQTFPGRVHQIVTEPGPPRLALGREPSRYTALVTFENRFGLVKPDQPTRAHVSVRTGAARNALVVPRGAVHRDDTGRPFVRVLREGQWQPVLVDTGLSDGAFVALRSAGLREGETIQVTPGLLDGKD
jgi:multidrug efflux pump subunit AcrA (membrane-fusion protein)